MKYNKILPLIIFVILVGGFISTQLSSTNRQAPIVRETAKVIRVVDGDTIKVLIQDKEDTVRLIGIDSPEVADERKPIQCFGKEASDKAKEILTDKTITLESDLTQGNRDEYGR
ncbi:MAG: thermonuclease family protein, partial [Candidatus Levybacteria bacterium]|nr:thermonuclease family protein [Candidatus Levybacteria bacterium]